MPNNTYNPQTLSDIYYAVGRQPLKRPISAYTPQLFNKLADLPLQDVTQEDVENYYDENERFYVIQDKNKAIAIAIAQSINKQNPKINKIQQILLFLL